MRKSIFTISLLLSLSIGIMAQSNLKKSVGVVRPHNAKDCETFFKSLASSIRMQGYDIAAKYVASFGSNSFSSCFVVKGNDGRYYAITNRHAIEYADYAMVQFIEGRDTITYDELQIAGVSEEMDLAAVKLPDGVDFTELTLYNGHISDGADVFTAGFPGVSNKPSWQFGKGIVSNAKYYNEALTNDDNRSVIQHTAQIDAGSSGGPLLVRNGDNYLVAGVNTWKVSNREGMNLAINSSDLQQFIASLGTSRKESASELAGIYTQITAKAKDGYRNILPRLSYNYLFYLTSKDIDKSFNNMTKEMRDDIDKLMEIGHFTESLRLLAAYNATRQMEENPFQFEAVTVKDDNEVILQGSDKMEVVFTWEKGAWRILKIGKNASKRQVGRDADEISGTGINKHINGYLLQGSVLAPVTKDGILGGQGSFGFMSRFTTYEIVFDYFRIAGKSVDEFNRTYTFLGNKLGVGPRFGGQIPIQVSPHVVLVPNIKVLLEAGIPLKAKGKSTVEYNYYDDEDFYIGIAPSAGVNCMFKMAQRKYIFLGISYEHKILLSPGMGKNNKFNYGYIAAHLGFLL